MKVWILTNPKDFVKSAAICQCAEGVFAISVTTIHGKTDECFPNELTAKRYFGRQFQVGGIWRQEERKTKLPEKIAGKTADILIIDDPHKPTAMQLSKREEFMLWKLLEFPIHRYLLSLNRSGVERAERHIEISKIVWEVRHVRTALSEHHEQWMAIHDLIAEKITNHLDRTIGYDPDAQYAGNDFDVLADKLFKRILRLEF